LFLVLHLRVGDRKPGRRSVDVGSPRL